MRVLLCVALGAWTLPAAAQEPPQDAARRVIAMTSLAAKEYADGVSGGTVVSAEEVEEAALFLEEARRGARGLPDAVAAPLLVLLDSAAAVVAETGAGERLARLAARAEAHLREALSLADPLPALRPSASLGQRVFAQNCTECHGRGGAGDGFRAARLDPPPADLTDPEALGDQSPLDHFRKIRFGVAGTDMDGFEDQLDDDEIWAVVWHVAGLRASDAARARGRAAWLALCPACGADVAGAGLMAAPARLADPAQAATATDDDLRDAVRRMADSAGASVGDADAAAIVAYLRTLPHALPDGEGPRRAIALTQTELARAAREARLGNTERASALVFDAYAVLEGVEAEIRLRDPALVAALETSFAAVRGRLPGDGGPVDLSDGYARLAAELQTAQAVLDGASSAVGLFVQSFVLLIREGLEAILIVGALATIVVRAGAPERQRDVWWGAGAAVGASVVTAVLLESVFRLEVAEREALEGFVMLLATAVLLSVSYWLLAKVEVRHWKAFVTAKVQRALTSGSMLTLAGAAFLAVYREGFETVLFYKALFITVDGQGAGPIGAGGAAAAVCLVGIYLGVTYAGVRIPMRAFFGTTSAILFYMAFTFAGKGIAELQESQLVNTTLLDWAPSVPWMGMYPTVQTTVVQAALLGLLLLGVLWTFVMQPRRLAAKIR